MTAMQQALVNSKLASQEQVSQVKIVPGHLKLLVEELELLTKKIPDGDKVDIGTQLLYSACIARCDRAGALQVLINGAKRRLQELSMS